MSYNLNFNLIELCSYSLNPSTVIVLEYLHLNYQKSVCNKLIDLEKVLGLKLPSLQWAKLLKSRKNTYKSNFKLAKPITQLKYIKILTKPFDVQIKFLYLYYTSLLAPYDKLKFIPKEVYIGKIDELIFAGLAEEVRGGIILIHER